MSAPSRSVRPAGRTTALQALALLTGFLIVLAFAMVGAWPMCVLLGTPLLVAAVLAPSAPRIAAVMAGLAAAVIAVLWIVYTADRGFAMDDPWSEVWVHLAGPAAAVTVPVAVLQFLSGRPDRFTAD